MKLAHVTDPHFDHLRDPDATGRLAADVRNAGCDAVVVTGDLAEAPTFERHARSFALAAWMPVYFVLGNHDAYRGSIHAARKAARRCEPAVYLGDGPIVTLAPGVALTGDDGWYDARAGAREDSRLRLNDERMIEEFRGEPRGLFVARSRRLADESAVRIARVATAAAKDHRVVVLATHVPPFREASRAPNGSQSDSDWAPFFVNVAMGEALLGVAAAHPDTRFVVLCGHTHTRYVHEALPNLVVRVGAAAYGKLMFDVVEIS